MLYSYIVDVLFCVFFVCLWGYSLGEIFLVIRKLIWKLCMVIIKLKVNLRVNLYGIFYWDWSIFMEVNFM